jgi:hypothetical protein
MRSCLKNHTSRKAAAKQQTRKSVFFFMINLHHFLNLSLYYGIFEDHCHYRTSWII